MPDWSWADLRLLMEVSRHGSLSRAGEAIGKSASTLSRRLDRLEAQVGQPLLLRTPEGCTLTDAGRELAAVAQDTDRALRRAHDRLEQQLSGQVQLSCGDGFVAFLTPLIARFCEAHPECSVGLQVDDSFLHIERGEADLALRTLHRGEASLVYRELGVIRYSLAAAPSLIARFQGQPLERWPRVGLLPPLDGLGPQRALSGLGPVVVRSNSFSAHLDAVRAGVGLGAVPLVTMEGLHPLPGPPLPTEPLYLVSRRRSELAPQVRAFVALLVAEIPALLAG